MSSDSLQKMEVRELKLPAQSLPSRNSGCYARPSECPLTSSPAPHLSPTCGTLLLLLTGAGGTRAFSVHRCLPVPVAPVAPLGFGSTAGLVCAPAGVCAIDDPERRSKNPCLLISVFDNLSILCIQSFMWSFVSFALENSIFGRRLAGRGGGTQGKRRKAWLPAFTTYLFCIWRCARYFQVLAPLCYTKGILESHIVHEDIEA